MIPHNGSANQMTGNPEVLDRIIYLVPWILMYLGNNKKWIVTQSVHSSLHIFFQFSYSLVWILTSFLAANCVLIWGFGWSWMGLTIQASDLLASANAWGSPSLSRVFGTMAASPSSWSWSILAWMRSAVDLLLLWALEVSRENPQVLLA